MLGKKPIKYSYPKVFPTHALFRPPFMFLTDFDGPNRGAKIYDTQIFPDPQTILLLTEGGSGIGDKIYVDLDGLETSA
jgi:hypothetical protein